MVPKFISHLSYWADRADLSPTLTKAHHGTNQGTIQSICFMLVVFQFPPVTCANPFCLEHHGGPSASKPNFALLFLFSEFSALPPLNNQHHANNTSTGRGPYRRIMFFFRVFDMVKLHQVASSCLVFEFTPVFAIKCIHL